MTDTARLQRDPGSPVSPPKKIIICHNGRTIRVSEKAVPAHYAHGDQISPCQEDKVICNNGKTRVVNLGHPLGVGDYEGPCTNQTFMCNLQNRNIIVDADVVVDHLARGQLLGLCPGKNLICHNGHTIIVKSSALPAHLAHGDSEGYCLGAPGPVINYPPPTSASR